jgi:hypothetical protein
MRCDRAVGEIGQPAPDRAGILQERLRCEDRVAVIDRVLRITDQMGEAELVRLGVCALHGHRGITYRIFNSEKFEGDPRRINRPSKSQSCRRGASSIQQSSGMFSFSVSSLPTQSVVGKRPEKVFFKE